MTKTMTKTLELLRQPIFTAGLLLKLALAWFIVSPAAANWYVPFLESSVSIFSLDPWSHWLNVGGPPEAFPYGYVMWLVFIPAFKIFSILGIPFILAYNFTLLAFDLAILLVLQKLFKNAGNLLLLVYWLSIITVVATYFYGFNDLIPLYFLIMAVYFARELKFKSSGVFCALAISAKLSMITALPFFFIWLLRNKALRSFVTDFSKGLVVAGLIVWGPYLFSPAAISMLLNNPEMNKIYQLSINIGNGTKIYMVPLIYLLTLYAVWRVQRLNFDLFYSVLGFVFLTVVLLTPASPGWYVWVVPFLVPYQLKNKFKAICIVTLFSSLYVINVSYLGANHTQLAFTLLLATGLVMIISYGYSSISRSDYFRLSRRPFLIGVAGDSGAGKDTYVNAVSILFGEHSVTKVSGDDYHLWDRHKPMWKVLTHLNPFANDLESFTRDVIDLKDKKNILARHYNHVTGKMTVPHNVSSNDFIIASGLHALYSPILRSCYDLTIYLDMNEELRKHFKVIRDRQDRGHAVESILASIERRGPDSNRFVKPQINHADLVFSLEPISKEILSSKNNASNMRFRLLARYSNSMNELSLIRALVGICGLHVDMVTNETNSQLELMIEGESMADDMALAAKLVCPSAIEFLDIAPKWLDGVLGLMQLITLSHIEQKLSKRLAI